MNHHQDCREDHQIDAFLFTFLLNQAINSIHQIFFISQEKKGFSYEFSEGICQRTDYGSSGNTPPARFEVRGQGAFFQKQDGDIVISNASAQAIRKAQVAFAGATKELGVADEGDIQALIDNIRYGKAG